MSIDISVDDSPQTETENDEAFRLNHPRDFKEAATLLQAHLALDLIGDGTKRVVRRCSERWFVFTGKVYEVHSEEEMQARCRPFLDRFWYFAKPKNEDSEPRPTPVLPTMGYVREVLTALTALPGVMTTDQPDQNTDEIICANGRLQLRTGTLEPHSADVWATRMTPVEFPTDENDPELGPALNAWQTQLDSLKLHPETLRYVHRALGYACTGRGTEKAFFFHYGLKDTGKSTLIYLAMSVLGRTKSGGYAALTTTSDWLEGRGGTGSGHTDSLMSVEGARLVFGDEFPETGRFNTARLKATCSGMQHATLRLSAKGEKGRDVPVKFALFFASNSMPATQDKATQERMKVITHSEVIGNPNPNFEREFMTPKMKQAVLLWLAEGAQEYLAKGLGMEPASVMAQRAEYQADNDQLGPFLNECLMKSTNPKAPGVKSSDLHKAYVQWAREHGQFAAYSLRSFKQMVEERLGVKAYKLGGSAAFKGYCLVSDFNMPHDAESLDLDEGL